tara:strand:- start:10 stop:255 length:246 start_codon:yes stop_codon:yes gene_type:complete
MKTKAQELGITNFPYEEFDENGNETYTERSDGNWWKRKYDNKGYLTYYENCLGTWKNRKYNNKGYLTYVEWSDGHKTYHII